MTGVYFDMQGEPCRLEKLCREEPEWAASRIATMREELRAASATIEMLTLVHEAAARLIESQGAPEERPTYALAVLARSTPQYAQLSARVEAAAMLAVMR